jgi:cation-transporting ATPase E
VFIALVVVNIMYKQSWSNVLFMLIILVNIVIGIVQEIRAKKTIEKLSLLTAPTVKVIRDKVKETIAMRRILSEDDKQIIDFM